MDRADIIDSISAELGENLQIAGERKVPIVTCTVEDVLGPEDIAAYCSKSGNLETTQKSDQKDLSVLRAKHHSVARYLATGIPEGLVAELTGFTPAYISTLKNNPSMIELVAHYRAPGDNATRQIAEKMRTIGEAALERIETELPSASMNELIQIAKLGADRSNNGPMSKVDVAHTHTIDLERVAQFAADARRRNQDRIVDISAVRQSLPAPRAADDDEG